MTATAKKISARTGNPNSVFKPKRHLCDRFVDDIRQFVEDGDPHDLLSSDFVASKLRVSTAWLDSARANKFGPEFVRLSPSVVRYPRGKFIKWLRSRSEIPERGQVRVAHNRGMPGRPRRKADPTKPSKPNLQAAE
jgi:hypothetical protein